MLNGGISSTKGQHVTRITCCDWRHTKVTGVALMWPESHLCGWSRILVTSFVTGVTNTWPETQLCNCSSRKSTRGHAHQNSIYSRPFGSDFSFPSHVLLYFYASNQAARYIVTHTRDNNSRHHQGNSYTISLGWYHNTNGLLYILFWEGANGGKSGGKWVES